MSKYTLEDGSIIVRRCNPDLTDNEACDKCMVGTTSVECGDMNCGVGTGTYWVYENITCDFCGTVNNHCHSAECVDRQEQFNRKQYVFKLRRKSDGLFSTGGSNHSFTKDGKIWTGIGHLKASVTLSERYRETTFDDKSKFEVVKLQLVEKIAIPLDEA